MIDRRIKIASDERRVCLRVIFPVALLAADVANSAVSAEQNFKTYLVYPFIFADACVISASVYDVSTLASAFR